MVKLFLSVAVVAAALIAPAHAQGAEARLSLDECLNMALDNNLDLVSARFGPELSEERVTVQDAAFDLGFQANLNPTGFKRRASTRFQASGSGETISASAGVQQSLKMGGTYSANLTSSRETGSNTTFEPFYNAGLDLTWDQPLLAGRGRDVTTEALVLARNDLDISREDLRVQVHSTMELVENAYWDVLANIAGLRVAKEALERAEDLLEQNRKKVEVGTLPPIDITQAEAGVAQQEEGVIVAEEALFNSEDELRRLMGLPPSDPLWGQRIVPTDEPDLQKLGIDVESAIVEAFANRPELIRARKQLDSNELSVRSARNRARGDLNLNTRLSPSGQNELIDPDGSTMPPMFMFSGDETGSSYDDALSELPELSSYFWSVSLTYTIPLGNRQAKANYRIAQLNRDQNATNLQNQEQNIRVEVRRAARGVETGVKRIDAAQANVVLQKKNLEAEQKKFENGMSTSFQVLEFQKNLSDAEVALIRAVVAYRRSLVAFEKAKGSLLESRNLRFEP